jgi:hypothetical protein
MRARESWSSLVGVGAAPPSSAGGGDVDIGDATFDDPSGGGDVDIDVDGGGDDGRGASECMMMNFKNEIRVTQ